MPGISPVYITGYPPPQQRMKKSCVKFDFIVFIRPFHQDLAELVLPGPGGGGFGRVKSEVLRLGQEICFGIGRRRVTQPDFDFQYIFARRAVSECKARSLTIRAMVPCPNT